MKLILFPLSILILIAMLSMLGLGSTSLSSNFTLYENPEGWYDQTGALIAYANYSDAGDGGHMNWVGGVPYWSNASGSYLAYDNADGVTADAQGLSDISFSTDSALGLIGLIVGIMALATIAGVRVMGSGVSDASVSTIIKGSALIALWSVFSVLSLSLISMIPMFGVIIYFVLTAIYTVGIIGQVGGGSGE